VWRLAGVAVASFRRCPLWRRREWRAARRAGAASRRHRAAARRGGQHVQSAAAAARRAASSYPAVALSWRTALSRGCSHPPLPRRAARSSSPPCAPRWRFCRACRFVHAGTLSPNLGLGPSADRPAAQRAVRRQVATFGSVPLKTYLPDGDIDLSLVGAHASLCEDSWPEQVLAALRAHAAPLQLTDTLVINAEVRLRAHGARARAPPRSAAPPASATGPDATTARLLPRLRRRSRWSSACSAAWPWTSPPTSWAAWPRLAS
jgi:hypothetical protein